MTVFSNNKISSKFLLINLSLLLFCIVFIPILRLLLSLLQYSPSGTFDDFFWINPFLTLVPFSYVIVSLYFLFKKNILKFSIFLLFAYLLLHFIINFYGEKRVRSDFQTLFMRVGIVKK